MPSFSIKKINFCCSVLINGKINVNDDEFYKKGHYIFLNHSCRTDGATVTLNDEAQEYRWVTLDEALELPLNSYTRVTIKQLKKNRS